MNFAREQKEGTEREEEYYGPKQIAVIVQVLVYMRKWIENRKCLQIQPHVSIMLPKSHYLSLLGDTNSP